MSSRAIHVVAGGRVSVFLCKAEWSSVEWTTTYRANPLAPAAVFILQASSTPFPDWAPVILPGNFQVEFWNLTWGTEFVKGGSGFSEDCLLRLLVPTVNYTESFEVWPNVSTFWPAIFPTFLERRLDLLSLGMMATGRCQLLARTRAYRIRSSTPRVSRLWKRWMWWGWCIFGMILRLFKYHFKRIKSREGEE